MAQRISYTSHDGHTRIDARVWPVDKPRACVQLCHGMCEHVERYDRIARFFNAHGMAACGNSHLGHGDSRVDPDKYGYFGERGAHVHLYEDLELLRQQMTRLYPDVPYFIVGHSMGSFITRLYTAHYGRNISGAVFVGTSGPNPLATFGEYLARTVARVQGAKVVSPLLVKLSNGDNLKRIPDARTSSDWLSRDTEFVDSFIADPQCGFEFTASAYAELAKMIKLVSAKSWYASVPRQLPLLLISGEADPIGQWGAGVKRVYDLLRAQGCDVAMKLYPGARHDIINELNRDEVHADILAFVEAHIPQC